MEEKIREICLRYPLYDVVARSLSKELAELFEKEMLIAFQKQYKIDIIERDKEIAELNAQIEKLEFEIQALKNELEIEQYDHDKKIAELKAQIEALSKLVPYENDKAI